MSRAGRRGFTPIELLVAIAIIAAPIGPLLPAVQAAREAAITSRSWHPGGVNAAFGGGGVRSVKSSIDGQTWRAMGSVAGVEVITGGNY